MKQTFKNIDDLIVKFTELDKGPYNIQATCDPVNKIYEIEWQEVKDEYTRACNNREAV